MKSRLVVASDGGWGGTDKVAQGNFWSDGNILCSDCGGGYMTVCL